jgi:hypothetical protein
MKTPTALVLTTTVAGVDNANPAGNGTGVVTINVKATDALTYKVDFGDGNTEMVPSGVITYKYTSPGTSDYNITVNAIGTGGIISNTSKKITVFVAFTIPTANNNVSMDLDNKGTTFVLGAAVSYYGLSGPEAQYPITTKGVKRLSFMDATSASTAANSTRIQFMVPGNGLVLIGMGSNKYEILSLTATTMILRTIGADGNSWYEKLKVK